MNKETKAKALDVYEKRLDVRDSVYKLSFGSDILDLVIDEDRSKLIPYIEDELKAATQLGVAGVRYANELHHLKKMIEEEMA